MFETVKGVDISPRCVERATHEFPGVKFIVGDAESTGFRDNSVDILTYFSILHHFPDFTKVAKEANRILKPGGRFFSFDPHH